jgi:hypothetical protein
VPRPDVRIDSIGDIVVLPDGFKTMLILNGEPDELLSGVIERWPLGPAGLTGLEVVRDHMVVSTELDVDAPARAVQWLRDGPDPALQAMQRHADNLRAAGAQALAKAQHALRAPV